MTFSKWRQQLRLIQAMRLLAEGAFISMFKKTLGTTTTLYFKTDAKDK